MTLRFENASHCYIRAFLANIQLINRFAYAFYIHYWISKYMYFTDIDECVSDTHRHSCSEYAICTNVIGSYNCTCYSKFTGDGKICTGNKLPVCIHKMCPLYTLQHELHAHAIDTKMFLGNIRCAENVRYT